MDKIKNEKIIELKCCRLWNSKLFTNVFTQPVIYFFVPWNC